MTSRPIASYNAVLPRLEHERTDVVGRRVAVDQLVRSPNCASVTVGRASSAAPRRAPG